MIFNKKAKNEAFSSEPGKAQGGPVAILAQAKFSIESPSLVSSRHQRHLHPPFCAAGGCEAIDRKPTCHYGGDRHIANVSFQSPHLFSWRICFSFMALVLQINWFGDKALGVCINSTGCSINAYLQYGPRGHNPERLTSGLPAPSRGHIISVTDGRPPSQISQRQHHQPQMASTIMRRKTEIGLSTTTSPGLQRSGERPPLLTDVSPLVSVPHRFAAPVVTSNWSQAPQQPVHITTVLMPTTSANPSQDLQTSLTFRTAAHHALSRSPVACQQPN